MENSNGLSLGQFRVGVSFNPSKIAKVDAIKSQIAALIDTIAAIQGDAEVQREKALAMTHLEMASMLAVKACVWEEAGKEKDLTEVKP
jgi:hypothetical protein